MNWLNKMLKVRSEKDLLDNCWQLFKINQSKTSNRLVRISVFSYVSAVLASSNFFLGSDAAMLATSLSYGSIFKMLSDTFILGSEYILCLGMLGSECLLLGTWVSLIEGLFVRLFGLDRNHWNNISESELNLNKMSIENDIELNTRKAYQKIINTVIEKLKISGKIKDDSWFYNLLATNEENLEFSELDSKLSEFEGLIREKLIVEKYLQANSCSKIGLYVIKRKNGLFVSRRLSIKVVVALATIFSSALTLFILKFGNVVLSLGLMTDAMASAFFFTFFIPLISSFIGTVYFSAEEEQASMQSLKDSFDEAKEAFRFDTLDKYQPSDLNAIKQETSGLSKKLISDCITLFDKLSSDTVEGDRTKEPDANSQKTIAPVIKRGAGKHPKPYVRAKNLKEN